MGPLGRASSGAGTVPAHRDTLSASWVLGDVPATSPPIGAQLLPLSSPSPCHLCPPEHSPAPASAELSPASASKLQAAAQRCFLIRKPDQLTPGSVDLLWLLSPSPTTGGPDPEPEPGAAPECPSGRGLGHQYDLGRVGDRVRICLAFYRSLKITKFSKVLLLIPQRFKRQ